MSAANHRVAQVNVAALARCPGCAKDHALAGHPQQLQTFDLYNKLDVALPFSVTAEIEIAGGSVSNGLFLYFDHEHCVGPWDERVHDCESLLVDDSLRAIQVASAAFHNGLHINAGPPI
ncbi:Uu.00g130510.m01.CDS01 [Anthostomella pinea]|uniref:Uu.00g130510.m01.CDS01 n=1 Tax=Anthostomella pinea TaxID=933095 RepID=A0AAI8YIA8_9PEZI|nr:Uu.00g130510.m01.CDS01 [Anthostomella pinea]